MPITDFLERNAKIYPNDVALVEINPEKQPSKNMTWREYSLIETAAESDKYRREITWRDFDIKANRFANLLFTRGIKKGDKVLLIGQSSLGLYAVLLAYVFPFLLILVTLFIASVFTDNELLSGTISLSVVLPYYVVLSMNKKRLKKKFSFEIIKL